MRYVPLYVYYIQFGQYYHPIGSCRSPSAVGRYCILWFLSHGRDDFQLPKESAFWYCDLSTDSLLIWSGGHWENIVMRDNYLQLVFYCWSWVKSGTDNWEGTVGNWFKVELNSYFFNILEATILAVKLIGRWWISTVCRGLNQRILYKYIQIVKNTPVQWYVP